MPGLFPLPEPLPVLSFEPDPFPVPELLPGPVTGEPGVISPPGSDGRVLGSMMVSVEGIVAPGAMVSEVFLRITGAWPL